MPLLQNEMKRAADMDAADPLASYRDRFHIPTHGDGSAVVYLCGNSLGLQPKSVRSYVEQELKDWELLGVEGHLHASSPWLPYHELLAPLLARLVGAKPGEVVAMNTLTVNLHLMMVSFYRPTPDRYKILIEPHTFPSDRYAVWSQLRFHGYDPEQGLVELPLHSGGATVRMEDVEKVLREQGEAIALVLIGGVNYYSGQLFEMGPITRLAHDHGCTVGFDLAHAVGNVPLQLHEWGVDFAVWCSYKYLNSGPGSVAGCFVHERHADNAALPRFAGWWGHDKATRFQMGPAFHPIPGAEGWQLSNPPILPLAAQRASLEIFDEAGMDALRAKSEQLTGFMEQLILERLGAKVRIITPAPPAHRGAQLSLRVPGEGRTVFRQLTSRGVVCDWREPDVIRVAPVPLYNSFQDVCRFVEHLRNVLGAS